MGNAELLRVIAKALWIVGAIFSAIMAILVLVNSETGIEESLLAAHFAIIAGASYRE